MINYRKFIKGTQIKPKTSTESDSQGDMEVLSSDGKLKYHNGTSNSSVVTEAHSATLTNKTIDADSNTISNIDNADIKSGAAIDRSKLASGAANRLVVNDGSGVLSDATAITASRALVSDSNGIPVHSSVSSTELGYVAGVTSSIQTQLDAKALASDLSTHISDTSTHGVSGDILGNSDAQVITNKDIDGGTASNTHRITVPKDTTSNLAALTRKEATVVYDTTKDTLAYDDGSNIVDLVKGGSSPAASGEPVLIDKSNGDLRFKKLVAGSNITLTPSSNTLTISSSGGGGGGSGTAGIEVLMQKADAEKASIFTSPLDNSVYTSGISKFIDSVTGILLQDTASSSSSLELAWNPVFLNDSDKDTDSTTNYTAVGAGTVLTTSATAKIGALSLSFNKTTGDTEAGIRYDRGSQNLSLASNTEMFVYINLPILTNLSDVYVKIYKDSTSNYRKYLKTTDQLGNALTTGWNLIKVDLVNDSGTNTGSGWSSSDLSRYVEIGIDSANSTDLFVSVLVDSIMFSLKNPNTLGLNGQQISLFNTTNKETVLFDSSGSTYSGRISLSGTTTNSYTGGSGSGTGKSMRNTLVPNNYIIGFNSSLSGAIALSQEVMLSRKIRESLTGTLNTIVDIDTAQLNIVTVIGGSTIDIDDSSNLSANYVNGDVVDIVRPMYSDGDVSYKYIATKTLTANSSNSSGVTTLTLDVTSIVVNDLVIKRQVSTSISVVSETSNESFSSASLLTSPNGVQVLDNLNNYPYRDKLVGSFSLGGSYAMSNVSPNPLLSINTNGTSPSPNANFLYGRLGTTSFGSGSNYYIIPSGFSSYFDGASRMVVSFWFYGVAFSGTTYGLMSNFSTPITGWGISRDSGANNLTLFQQGTVASVPYNVGKWNHCLLNLLDGSCYIIVNGVKSTVLTSNITGLNQNLLIGNVHTGLGIGLTNNDILSDLNYWYNSPEFTEAQAQQIYRSGDYRPFGSGVVRYRYEDAGLTGQKISTKIKLDRTTNAVTPVIIKAGSILE